jgi:hypothetical protein
MKAPNTKKEGGSRDDNQFDWDEPNIRIGLARLIRELRKAVASARRKAGLEDGRKLTGRERAELAFFRNQHHFLSRIPALVKALDHPAVGLRREMAGRNRSAAELRREQLYDLFAALSTAAIYRVKLKNPILSRLDTAGATEGKVKRGESTRQRVADALAKTSYTDKDFNCDLARSIQMDDSELAKFKLDTLTRLVSSERKKRIIDR